MTRLEHYFDTEGVTSRRRACIKMLRTIKPFIKFPFVLTSQLFQVVIKSFEGDQNALFRDFSCVIGTD